VQLRVRGSAFTCVHVCVCVCVCAWLPFTCVCVDGKYLYVYVCVIYPSCACVRVCERDFVRSIRANKFESFEPSSEAYFLPSNLDQCGPKMHPSRINGNPTYFNACQPTSNMYVNLRHFTS